MHVLIQACCHVLSKRPPGDDEEWKDLPQQSETYPSQKFIGKRTELNWVQLSHKPKQLPINSLTSDPERRPFGDRIFAFVQEKGNHPAQCEMGSLGLPGLFLACCISA